MNKYEISLKKHTGTFTLFSICLLAVCVSLGTATVSIAKLLVLIAFISQLFFDRVEILKFEIKKINYIFIWMTIACIWMLISMAWSDASISTQWKYFYAHTRFLWLGIIYYLIKSRERGLIVLKWLVIGQIAVVAISWLMWLGFELPFTRRPLSRGIAFTGYLEQPVMTTLVLIVLWHLRGYWSLIWSKWFLNFIMTIMALNIIFVMSGRSGYFVFICFVSLQIYKNLPYRYRWLGIISPLLLALIFSSFSSVFYERIIQIPINTYDFFNNNITTSEGGRLEMWLTIIKGIIKNPLLGSGIGSLSNVYTLNGGADVHTLSQPHQQYLFWLSEFGLIGFLIFMMFFYTLIKDASNISSEARSGIISISLVLFVMGMFNCPFFGVGMGEFFFLELAAFLTIRRTIGVSGNSA